MINYQYFPKSKAIPSHLKEVVCKFQQNNTFIDSDIFQHNSNEILSKIAPSMESLGFVMEKSKKADDKIKIPVLFGLNGKLEKYFDADGFNKETKTVIEIEAGRAVSNYQFLKDLFQACMMNEVEFLIIAVRNTYLNNQDFKTVITFFETLYASGRLVLPLEGILIIGY